MSKTPFELRFDTLRLARDHLLGAYDAQMGRLSFIDDHKRDAHLATFAYPDLSSIMETAALMKVFVDHGETPEVKKEITITDDIARFRKIIDDNLESPDLYVALNEEVTRIKKAAKPYTTSQQRFFEHLKVVYSAISLMGPMSEIPDRLEYLDENGESIVDFYYMWSNPIVHVTKGIEMRVTNNGGDVVHLSISGPGVPNGWTFQMYHKATDVGSLVFVDHAEPEWYFDMMVSWFGAQAEALKDMITDLTLRAE